MKTLLTILVMIASLPSHAQSPSASNGLVEANLVDAQNTPALPADCESFYRAGLEGKDMGVHKHGMKIGAQERKRTRAHDVVNGAFIVAGITTFSGGALVGAALVSDALEVASTGGSVLILAGFIGATVGTIILIDDLKNVHPWKKMIRLIDEAKAYSKSGNPDGLRLLNRLERQTGHRISVAELANSILKGNQDLSLCSASQNFQDIKREVR